MLHVQKPDFFMHQNLKKSGLTKTIKNVVFDVYKIQNFVIANS